LPDGGKRKETSERHIRLTRQPNPTALRLFTKQIYSKIKEVLCSHTETCFQKKRRCGPKLWLAGSRQSRHLSKPTSMVHHYAASRLSDWTSRSNEPTGMRHVNLQNNLSQARRMQVDKTTAAHAVNHIWIVRPTCRYQSRLERTTLHIIGTVFMYYIFMEGW
jgi:hypothetical protein